MAKQNQRKLPADLVRGRDRLDAWRRTKQPRSRIPEALWELAVKLVGKHGLCRTARTLKLDYYSLKQRVDSAEPRHGTNDFPFVELPSPLAAVPECVIEWEDGAVRLRLNLKGYSAADVATVGHRLRGSH